MGKMYSISGFIIAHRDLTGHQRLEMGKSTFGATAAEAWSRHMRIPDATGPDATAIRQAWSDRGYGPHRVTMMLREE